MDPLVSRIAPGRDPHPNEFDRKRIERALKTRVRYRYVTPRVLPQASGYRVKSPCCSRTIDPEGGIIDVALIAFDADLAAWTLCRKDHGTARWEVDSHHGRLVDLLEHLKADPERAFWQ